jgi:poly-gamma-glutamate synthesis protein (capsule biosynthesis protein)
MPAVIGIVGYGCLVSPRYLVSLVLISLAAAACTPSAAIQIEEPIASEVVTTLPAVTSTTATPASITTARTTTSAGEPVPTETPKQRLVVSGAGDVNLDPRFVRTFPSEGYEYAWTGLYGAFIADDLTIVNLECSPSDLGTAWVKPWTFRCDPEALPSMADAGVDVANLANNHGMDYGFEAMLDGKQNLTNVGIAPVGTGANYDDAYTPYMTEINGWTIAVIGSGGVNPESGSWLALDDRPGMTHGDDTESISAAIAEAKRDADLVLVTAHWGEQGTTRPRTFERRQAEAWIDAGADGVFGHHQHVLQPLEFYKGKPIAWGLGNFVWQAYPAQGSRTAIAQFVFEPDGRIGACLVPVQIERTGHPVIQNPSAPVCAPEGAL